MKLLFICTHNRCRSIMAEAICNHIGKGEITAKSAGSKPAGAVHTLTLKYLSEFGIATTGLRSKSWNEHEKWQPDFVITVCDSAADEVCPVWFGEAVRVHWGISDPSKLENSEEDVAEVFRDTIKSLQKRIAAFNETELKTSRNAN